MTERESQYRKELFKLMQENPDLPVVPMVDGEIPGDDCGYWQGAWGFARVDEYLIIHYQERLVFKSDDYIFDFLEHYLTKDEFNTLPEDEDKCKEIYNKLPWIKAIVVYITLPE